MQNKQAIANKENFATLWPVSGNVAVDKLRDAILSIESHDFWTSPMGHVQTKQECATVFRILCKDGLYHKGTGLSERMYGSAQTGEITYK